jgi:hypothetical protein
VFSDFERRFVRPVFAVAISACRDVARTLFLEVVRLMKSRAASRQNIELTSRSYIMAAIEHTHQILIEGPRPQNFHDLDAPVGI